MELEKIWISISLVIFSYLFGSIPTGYLIGKWIKKVDLRDFGSGTVSGSMVFEHIAKWAVVPVGLFDIFKGALTTWLSIRLGIGEIMGVICGLVSVVGHNWPIYLQFHGGRGLSPFIGMLLILFPWGCFLLLAALAIGFFLGDSAPFAILTIALMPFIVNLFDGPAIIGWLAIGMAGITVIKRVEANRRPLPSNLNHRIKVILLRIFFDRDITDHQSWISQFPSDKTSLIKQ